VTLGVLVLAAGKSTRIASVSGGLPKPLIEIAGRPVIVHTLRWLAQSGIRDVWVNLHYRPEVIRAALGTGEPWGVSIQYREEAEVLGTAGAWKNLESEWRGTSLVVYGDNLIRLDLARMLMQHRERERSATIAVFDPRRTVNSGIAGGRVRCEADGVVRDFVEGGADGFVNAGVYLLEPSILADVPPDIFVDFSRDVLPGLAARRQLDAYVMTDTDFCLGVDTPSSLEVAFERSANGELTLP